MLHAVKFERNVYTGMWRATCTCGWIAAGAEDAVKAQAASHDIDWEFAGQFEVGAMRRDARR